MVRYRGCVTGLATFLLVSAVTPASAQRVRRSQRASVSQTVGTTEVTVTYSRPVARGRQLFGGVVRYGGVWTPGANEATRVEFSADVSVAGNALPAGLYSLWMIPKDGGDWTVIFSRAWDVFHIPYPEGHDALRFAVAPTSGDHTELLTFSFPVVGSDSAVLEFRWGTTVVELPIRIP